MPPKPAFYIALALIGLFYITSCSKNDSPPEVKAYRFSESITIDGIARTYTLNLPPNYYDASGF